MMRTGTLRRWGLLAPLLIAGTHSAEAGKHNVSLLTEAYNASGQTLFREIPSSPGNVVFSPYSVGAAMAMLRSGARGDTEREMAAVLHHPLSRGEIDAANASLLSMLTGYDRTTQPDYCPQGARWTGKHCEAPASGDSAAPYRCPKGMQPYRDVCVGLPLKPSAKLLAANVLMLTKHGAVSQDYRATVREKYAAAIYQRDGLDEVNRWFKQKMEGNSDQILDSADRDTGSVLLNSVYLKAGWAFPFTETTEDEFMLSASEKVRVAMMRKQGGGTRLVERAAYRAIRLDYGEPSLAMIIVLPNDVDGLDLVSRELDAGKLASLVADLKRGIRRVVALTLPRFKAAFDADLVPRFRKAGMILAFGDSADLSGMTGATPGDGRLKIGAIRHRAAIKVDEQGSGAAAWRVPIFVPRKELSFTVDRPFLFYVVDDASGAILLQGRIVDPRK